MQDGWSSSPREVAIDAKSAVLVEANGEARVVGNGKGAYFIRPAHKPEVCQSKRTLTFRSIAVYHAPPRSTFNLATRSGAGGTPYVLSVRNGTVESSSSGGLIY